MGKPDQLGDAVRSVIRAFHASPYRFNKFDSSHMGRGEGQQAYGPGLYFAQSPAVADEYHKQFQRFRPTTTGEWSKQTVRDAEETLAQYGGDRELAVQSIEALLPTAVDDLSFRPQLEDAIAYLRASEPPRATRYEVELPFSEKSMLDWDAPLSKQNDAVRSVIREDDLYDIAADGGMIGPDFDTAGPLGPILQGHSAAGGRQAAFNVFDQLRDAGVPGTRYLDGFSRAGQRLMKPTRNYVVYPGAEDAIRILRKW